jgi:DNA-binding NarL/FixJ family response regulator
VLVLAELSRGTPDTVACRNLHMSPRTYSRRVAELLDHLGAESRFQGGAQAVRRGWLVGACRADAAEGR